MEARGNKSDLFRRGQRDQNKLVRDGLGQVPAGGAVIGIVVAGERGFAVGGGGFVVVVGAFAMMVMAGMLRDLVASVVVLCRTMRMSASC